MLNASDGHRLLNSLLAISLDTETTGLDVMRDRIVSIAGWRLKGTVIRYDESFDELVKPDIPIPASSTAIHGLTDETVGSAASIAEVMPRASAFCGDCTIIGYNTAFDLAILRFESARCQKVWRNRAWLDTGLLAIALNPALGSTGLESIASWLGVTVTGRHTAAGDARMAAEIFVRLIPRLRDAGVRTLAEAQRFQETAVGALAMQQAAGWFDTVSMQTATASTAAPTTAALARIDSFPYTHRVKSFMSSPPMFVSPDASFIDAVRRMHEAGIGSLFLGDPVAIEGVGIVTERDLVMAITRHGPEVLASRVGEHGSYPLISLEQDALCYRALGRMQRLGIRYLGITDASGRVVGAVSARSLLQTRTTRAILVGDQIAAAVNATGLAAAADELPALANGLLGEGVGAAEVTAVVSDVLRHITARAAAIAEGQLIAEGFGAAPVPWSLMVLGSAGRGESMLCPDQDNAIVFLGSEMHDAWFKALAQRLVKILDEAGIPYCKGEIMANNPAWRRNLAGWREEIDRWLTLQTESGLQNINAFFDLEPVYGERRIAAELQDMAVREANGRERTLETLARRLAGLRAPIGIFGRFEVQDGRVDMKTAILPLVTAARLLALVQGSSARGTPDRLREASTGTLLSESEGETLIGIHQLLLDIVLRQQLRDLCDGVPPSYRVALAGLDADTTRRLRDALRHLDGFIRRFPEYCVRA